MSDTIVVMNQGYIQQIGSPEDIYNEPQNAFVADFIGDSNIVNGTMIQDKLVEIFGVRFACVDTGFGNNNPVDVVIRPEDVELRLLPDIDSGDQEKYDEAVRKITRVNPGCFEGTVSHIIFKGMHYEIEVQSHGFEWLVLSTRMFPVGSRVLMSVDPFNIQIMNKPASEAEMAVTMDEHL